MADNQLAQFGYSPYTEMYFGKPQTKNTSFNSLYNPTSIPGISGNSPVDMPSGRQLPVFTARKGFADSIYNPYASSNIADLNSAYEGLDVNSPSYDQDLAFLNDQAVEAADAGAFDSGLFGGSNSDFSFNPFGSKQGLANFGKGVDIIGSLYGADIGRKQLGLQEDAFNFNKAMKEKEYAMAKDAYDRQVARADSIDKQIQAGKATV